MAHPITAKILMADRTTRLLEDIHVGDMILGDDCKITAVSDIYFGKEETMLCFTTENKATLLLSKNSAVMTESGLKDASSLVIGNRLSTHVNYEIEFSAITKIEPIAYKDCVASLQCENANAYFANGILVGTFELETHENGNVEAMFSPPDLSGFFENGN